MTKKTWISRVKTTFDYTAPELWASRVEQLVDEAAYINDLFLAPEQVRAIINDHLAEATKKLDAQRAWLKS